MATDLTTSQFSYKIVGMSGNAFVIWFTGLSGAGKTTLCNAVAAKLLAGGTPVQILDGDEIRQGLCSDLGFSMEDRLENIRRIAFVADLLVRNHVVVLVAAISPLRVMREAARSHLGSLIEVFVDAPLHVCEARDPKGLYKRARAGNLSGFTGVASTYEPPIAADVICSTDSESIDESANKVIDFASTYHDHMRGFDIPKEAEAECTRTIAVDFDGVIANYDGWRGRDVFGVPRDDVVRALTDLRDEGWRIIVYTTRSENDISNYLHDASIPFDEINRNSNVDTLGCKPRANVYWDDRALTYSGDAQRDLNLIRNFRTWNGRL